MLHFNLRVLLLLVAISVFGCTRNIPPIQEGDLIFQTSLSPQSQAIQIVTRSQYSHMGIILVRDGNPYVLEAGGTVTYTPLARWIDKGKNNHYIVKRLRNASQLVTPESLARIRAEAAKLRGKKYDMEFGWSDNTMYCSELVWKIYQRALGVEIGTLEKLRDMDLSHPIVQAKLRERYGDAIPLDEIVITPHSMFTASNLVAVAEG